VVLPVVIVVDKGFDLGFKISGQEVVFQQDLVLLGLMPSLDFVLLLPLIRRTARMLQPFSCNHSARSPETKLELLSLRNRGLWTTCT